MLWFIFGYAVFLLVFWGSFLIKDSKKLSDSEFRREINNTVFVVNLIFLLQIAVMAFGLIFEWW